MNISPSAPFDGLNFIFPHFNPGFLTRLPAGLKRERTNHSRAGHPTRLVHLSQKVVNMKHLGRSGHSFLHVGLSVFIRVSGRVVKIRRPGGLLDVSLDK